MSGTAEFRIIRDLSLVPRGRNSAILIRHADRDGVQDRVVADDEGINETGAHRAVSLGRELARFPRMKLFTSPVGRCTETCAKMVKGYGKDVPIVRTEFLGMDAPFMKKPEKAYEFMDKLGLNGFIKAYVNDELDPKVVHSCPQGTKMLFSFAIERIKELRGGIGIFVTHDMILTPPMAFYFDYNYVAKGLVPFLDGIVLFETETGYRAGYGGRTIVVGNDGTPNIKRSK